jgi:hypothetical protein
LRPTLTRGDDQYNVSCILQTAGEYDVIVSLDGLDIGEEVKP